MPIVLFMKDNAFDSSPPYTNFAQNIRSGFTEEGRTNITVIVNTPEPCPVEYRNAISNTNLFSPVEQKLLKELPLEYKDVTTNSPPRDSKFIGMDKTGNSFFMEGFTIAQFQNVHSKARVKVFFGEMSKGKAIGASFRDEAGDGWEITFNGDAVDAFRQFKHWQLDGLWADFDGSHCSSWMRFKDGKAVGKWLVWNKTGSLYMEAEFKEPFDFIGHLDFSF